MIIAVVLAAAVLHAVWNAIVKATPDRLGTMARASLVGVVILLGGVWWVTQPAGSSWPWLVASVIVHVLYNLGLAASYRLGDFNQTYPLARGVGPIVVAIVAATVLHEPLSAPHAAGVVMIAGAVAVLGLTPWREVRDNRPAVVAAALTGLAIASYTLIDGVGVRRSGSAAGYTLWLMGLESAATVGAVALLRRSALREGEGRIGRGRLWVASGVVAVLSTLAYGLVLFAQTRGALAAVAALRESSVVVAALIGVLFFREPLGRVRIAASVAVAAGVVLLAVP
jgi:drug/metabolite transporter (DMT)-like permease